jgi:UDP-N-acetyl-D-glucosamine/UDP-N-acetyl-D-galactosamine dehydrogenase
MSTLNFQSTKIAIIGMGYVGLPLAVEFGKKWNTIGFDINEDRIQELLCGIDRTGEINAEEFGSKSLFYSSNSLDIAEANIYILTVPTPIDTANLPDLTAIKNASKLVASFLEEGDLVIYESTVYPGLTEEICVPILERSDFKLNENFYCGYSPERINPGDQSHRLKDITKIVSGSNKHALELVDQLYSSIIEAGTYKAPSIKVAEAAKVIENTQRDLNIALVNELSIIFNSLEIDTTAVLDAADTKWNFMKYSPGLVGGHCIGVDPYYLTFKSEQAGYIPQIILAGRKLNNDMPSYVAKKMHEHMTKKSIEPTKANIVILGFTFKENCPDIRNTKVIDLYGELKKLNINVEIFDPHVNNSEALKEYNLPLLESLKNSYYDAVILAVPHDDFIEQGHDYILSLLKPKHVFFDLKSSFNKSLSDFRL